MKKLQTNKEEILELHSKEKTHGMLLREQMGNIRSKLQTMIDNGQVTDAIGVVELETSNPDRKFAIKKKSKKNPGTFAYLFHDFKFGYFGTDGKFAYASGVWVPAPSKPKPPSIDDKFKDAEIDSYKKKFNAKTKEEAITSGWDLTNLKKVNIQGVDLYTQGSSQGTVTGVSEKQKQALASFKKEYGAKEFDEMTGEEQANWTEFPVPNSTRLFGTEIKLYRPSQQDMKIDTKAYDEFSKDYNLSEDECSDYILKYFEDYRTDRPVQPSYFKNVKPKVQFCKNKYHNRWGIRANSRKLNKILDLMSREINEFQGASLPPSFPMEGDTRHQWLLKNV